MFARECLMNLTHGVPLTIWYDWHDDGRDPKEPEHHFGTVRHEYSPGRTPVYEPKPAYLAAQTLTRLLQGYRFQKRLSVGTRHDYVMTFVRDQGHDVRLVAWTTSDTPCTVIIPSLSGRYLTTGHTGQSLPPLVGDAKGSA